jgi:Ca-activated chloride channel family protein
MVPPSSLAVSQKPRDVVFVIDRSGSMQGWKMLAARRATARMIDTLTSRDRFQVIAFDTNVEELPEPQAVYATDRNRYLAVEMLSRVDARGGTEMALPLQLAVKALAGGHDDRERVIVLVTDGQVGNEDHILREIAPSLKSIRVFTLGIDQAVNAGFLRRFAGAGGGLCELVESEDRLDDVMAKVHRRIGTPVATELRLAPHGLDLHWRMVAPSRLPDVYAGAPVTIFGRYKGRAPADAAIGVEGTSYGDPLSMRVARDSKLQSATWVGASWARAYIRELEDKYAIGAHDLEGEIVRVSKEFSVLSRFTAFLAVDRRQVVNPGGGLVQAVQPVESPAGWDVDALNAPNRRTKARLMQKSSAPMGGAMAGGMGAPPAAPMSNAPARSERERAITPPRPGYASAPPAGPSSSAPPPPRAPAARRPAPVMPASAMPRQVGSMNAGHPVEATKKQEAATPANPSAYLAKLATLARDLEAHAKGTHEPAALRLLRQRLREWVEDLRSVGGHDTLADAVGDQAERLGNALTASGVDLSVELQAIANVLAAIAGGGPLPPRKSGRVAFWK